MSDRGPSSSGGEGGDLDALRSRLDALHRSVEDLGRPDTAPPAQEAHGPPSAYTDPAPPPPPPPAYEPPPSSPPFQPPAAPPQPTPYDYPAAPVYEDPYTDPYAAPPAATNGDSEIPPELLPPANVTILDVGPFADLVELRHFEEAISRLDTVRDVHVRRFGHNRAKIEVGMLGPQSVGRELYRLGRPMEVEPGPDGEVIVDFSEIMAEELEVPSQPDRVVATPRATAMPTAGAGGDTETESASRDESAETDEDSEEKL